MHAKFQVTWFQNKRDIRHRSLDFVCLFLLGQVKSLFYFMEPAGSKNTVTKLKGEFKFFFQTMTIQFLKRR